jgi:hypothetical protein
MRCSLSRSSIPLTVTTRGRRPAPGGSTPGKGGADIQQQHEAAQQDASTAAVRRGPSRERRIGPRRMARLRQIRSAGSSLFIARPSDSICRFIADPPLPVMTAAFSELIQPDLTVSDWCR